MCEDFLGCFLFVCCPVLFSIIMRIIKMEKGEYRETAIIINKRQHPKASWHYHYRKQQNRENLCYEKNDINVVRSRSELLDFCFCFAVCFLVPNRQSNWWWQQQRWWWYFIFRKFWFENLFFVFFVRKKFNFTTKKKLSNQLGKLVYFPGSWSNKNQKNKKIKSWW